MEDMVTLKDNMSGGVKVSGGTFTMSGGEIIGNTAGSGNYGGGVFVENGIFTMEGGATISGNTGRSYGGGLFVKSSTFQMFNGKITENSFDVNYKNVKGGGVYVYGGTFSMSDGEISRNTAINYSSWGGGVFVDNASFTKTGGIIYGKNAVGEFEYASNKASETGHAVYFIIMNSSKKRNTTAGENINLDTNMAGTAGGWE
jgi:hypothetical protein